MDQIWVEDLRSLKSTGRISLRPINVLVGQNSSGKSTLLRVFPLLKQSVEKDTQSPILWYGRYVDFGSIAASRRRGANGGVTFGFQGEMEVLRRAKRPKAPYSLAVTLSESRSNKSYLSGYTFTYLDSKLVLTFSEEGRLLSASMGGVDFTGDAPSNIMLGGTAALLPGLVEFDRQEQPISTGVRYAMSPNADDDIDDDFVPLYWGIDRRLAVKKQVRQILDQYFRANTSEKKRDRLVASLGPLSKTEIFSLLTQGDSSPQSVRAAFEELGPDNNVIARLHGLSFLRYFPIWIASIDRQISGLAAGSSYMGPVRATAQRYYRIQELAVREVDFQGENLAMFLASLSDAERASLSQFASRFLGFSVQIFSESGHVEIRVTEGDGTPETNLADMGFGYSQILPIVAQVWAGLLTEKASKNHRILAIEQPELHLHPRLQAALADMFASAVQFAIDKGRQPVSLFIETHSEAIINRLGALIEQKQVRPGDVQILLFEPDRETKAVTVRRASFDENGILQGWPFGFLAG